MLFDKCVTHLILEVHVWRTMIVLVHVYSKQLAYKYNIYTYILDNVKI